MKKSFEIECPNDIGEDWLDAATIHGELTNHPHISNYDNIMVVDISEEVTKLRRVVAALFDESDTRVPKGFDQKSEDYAPMVAVHNEALMELTRALQDIGYRE